MDRWATFDCYGTLIDWNGGIRAELVRLFGTDTGGEREPEAAGEPGEAVRASEPGDPDEDAGRRRRGGRGWRRRG